ncbi:hypothetical protein HJFPF1_02496 [Paramyrothecium foliicola]|nr:hypothetical protein HJFPF1_02496 [Paramyrothecium foliicola]
MRGAVRAPSFFHFPQANVCIGSRLPTVHDHLVFSSSAALAPESISFSLVPLSILFSPSEWLTGTTAPTKAPPGAPATLALETQVHLIDPQAPEVISRSARRNPRNDTLTVVTVMSRGPFCRNSGNLNGTRNTQLPLPRMPRGQHQTRGPRTSDRDHANVRAQANGRGRRGVRGRGRGHGRPSTAAEVVESIRGPVQDSYTAETSPMPSRDSPGFAAAVPSLDWVNPPPAWSASVPPSVPASIPSSLSNELRNVPDGELTDEQLRRRNENRERRQRRGRARQYFRAEAERQAQ